MDAIVRSFKEYDVHLKCTTFDTEWIFDDLQHIVKNFEKLINALGFYRYKNLVFIACVIIMYRKSIDVKNITDQNVLFDTYLKFLDIIRKCMLSVNPRFWQSWFIWGFNNGFYSSCMVVENILFNGDTILYLMNKSCRGYTDIQMVFEMLIENYRTT